MLTMKAHETQAKNNDRAEDLRTKVLDKIEHALGTQQFSPDELTRLLAVLRPEPPR